MITAVDSSVILDVLLADPRHGEISARAMEKAELAGRLVVSEFVLAEIQPVIGTQMARFLEEWHLDYIPCSLDAAIEAGKMFGEWLRSGGKRGRIVADFLIAAHAKHHADRLLTRDRGFLHKHFRGIPVLMAR